jgi:hypothetical protein
MKLQDFPLPTGSFVTLSDQIRRCTGSIPLKKPGAQFPERLETPGSIRNGAGGTGVVTKSSNPKTSSGLGDNHIVKLVVINREDSYEAFEEPAKLFWDHRHGFTVGDSHPGNRIRARSRPGTMETTRRKYRLADSHKEFVKVRQEMREVQKLPRRQRRTLGRSRTTRK